MLAAANRAKVYRIDHYSHLLSNWAALTNPHLAGWKKKYINKNTNSLNKTVLHKRGITIKAKIVAPPLCDSSSNCWGSGLVVEHMFDLKWKGVQDKRCQKICTPHLNDFPPSRLCAACFQSPFHACAKYVPFSQLGCSDQNKISHLTSGRRTSETGQWMLCRSSFFENVILKESCRPLQKLTQINKILLKCKTCKKEMFSILWILN